MRKGKPRAKVSLGLDLSLTHTGYCVIEEGGKVLRSGVIKSKPNGDRPTDELERLMGIINEIRRIVLLGDFYPEVAVIENLAFSVRNSTSLTVLAGLSYMVRQEIFASLFFPFYLVAPTSLKKYITGKGIGEKDHMMMAIFKDYGFEASDNNEADAFGLAAIGLSVLGHPIKKETIPQKEVINLLMKQTWTKKPEK